MTNLLSNPVKLTEKGSVKLRARKLSESINRKVNAEITIADTGIGKLVNKLEIMFQKFTQADTRISRRFESTGLGLALTRSLVDMQYGTIAVESASGEGSAFVVTLSLQPRGRRCAGARRCPEGAATTSPILIVERIW